MRTLIALALLTLAACHATTAPLECAGTITHGGPFHPDTLALRCR